MAKAEQFDFLVIGGGSGGVRAARRAANLGKRTALFEKAQMGGTCVLQGCIPKKLMWYGARFLEESSLAKEYGWMFPEIPTLDSKLQKKRRKKEVQRLSLIYEKLLLDSKVEIINAEASFENQNTIKAGGKLYQAPHILVAVGGYPFKPDLPGVEHALTSNDIFELDVFPKSILVAGAGYIALEFAGIFQAIGVQTTILCRKAQVLSQFDQDVRSFFEKQAQVKGLNIVHHFEPQSITKTSKELTVQSKKGETRAAEKILFALGRKALTKPLRLENANIKINSSGSIPVNNHFETSQKGIYAVGDCADTPFQLTPTALTEAEVLIKNLFEKQNQKVDYRYVPSAVFSNPVISQVGLTEKQALDQSFSVEIFESTFRPLKYTIKENKTEEKMYMKLIVDKNTDKILGCHLVGDDSSEMIQGVAIALTAGAKKSDFDRTIGLHPSSAEELCTLRTPRTN